MKEGKIAGFDYHINPPVFFIGAALIIGSVFFSFIFGKYIDNLFGAIQTLFSDNAGWLYILVMNIGLLFCFFLLFSRYSNVRLGGPDAKPEFSTPDWFAMLFSAGMGIGLLFYGVAEPMFHFVAPPVGDPATADAARRAMYLTFLHWGLHPWAIYAIVGLSLAFANFNMGLPLTIRTAFYPILKERIHSWMGDVIDILATVATLFGVATSLGLGVQQVNAGLNHLFGIPQSALVQVFLIAIITAMATASVVKGLDEGIRKVSNLNISLAVLMLFFVLVLGPTRFIFDALVQNIGYYLQNLPAISTWGETYANTKWQNSWTIFYWAWWIAWSPFVGMFIARISKGRTVREYLMGVLFVPTMVTFLWITAFGDSAIYIELFGKGGIAKAVQENIPVSLFVLLENFPLAWLTSLLGIILVITFFVTSSDSGSMVIDIITAGGHPDPPKLQRLFWAILEGVVAAALLMGGGLVALQTAAITTGLPFAIVVVIMCYSLYKGLHDYVAEKKHVPTDEK